MKQVICNDSSNASSLVTGKKYIVDREDDIYYFLKESSYRSLTNNGWLKSRFSVVTTRVVKFEGHSLFVNDKLIASWKNHKETNRVARKLRAALKESK